MCLLSIKAARVVVVSDCLERRVAFTPGLVYLTVCVHVCGVQRGFVPLALTDSLIYLNPLLRACICWTALLCFPPLLAMEFWKLLLFLFRCLSRFRLLEDIDAAS